MGRPVLESYQKICALLEEVVYTDDVKHDILRELHRLGLRNGDTAKFARLRQNRGRLVRRSRNGQVVVVADGRSDWIGWVELTTDRCDELALFNTARVLLDVQADIVGVVEAESRLALKRFADAGVVANGRPRYPHVMVVDGNDERGIDVGIMSTHDYPIVGQRTHVDDADAVGRVYVLLSPAPFATAAGGGISRRGVWGGRRGTLWPIYDTMTKAVHAGSDHAAIYADLNLS